MAIASSSSIFERAKPTWIRTQSPGERPRRRVQEADVDVAPDPYDVNARETIDLIDHLDYLAWNRQTHFAILPQVS